MRFHQTKLYPVNRTRKTYYFDPISVSVDYTVERRQTSSIWGLIITSDIVIKNNFREISKRVGNWLSARDYYKLNLMVEMEMIKLKLKHLR